MASCDADILKGDIGHLVSECGEAGGDWKLIVSSSVIIITIRCSYTIEHISVLGELSMRFTI